MVRSHHLDEFDDEEVDFDADHDPFESPPGRRLAYPLRVAALLIGFFSVLAAILAGVWFALRPVPRPPGALVRVGGVPMRPAQPAEPQAQFKQPVVPGAKVEWTAVIDPRPGPAGAKLTAGKVILDDVARFERQPIKMTEPSSLFAFAMEEKHPRELAVLDLTTGKPRGRVGFDEILCFHPSGDWLVRRRQDIFEIVSVDTDKVSARVSQAAAGADSISGEMAGPDKLLLRLGIEFGRAHRHVVWDWTKNRLLIDKRRPTHGSAFGCSTLSPGGRYLVTLGHINDDEDRFGPDELVVHDLQTGLTAGQQSVAPPPRPAAPAAPAEGKPWPHNWSAIAFSQDGRRLGAVRSDRMLHIWDWTTGRLLRAVTLESPFAFLAGKERTPLAIVDENEPVVVHGFLHSPVTGSKLAIPELRPREQIAVYPASGWVVSLHKDPDEFGQIDGPKTRWFIRTTAFEPAEFARKDADVAVIDPGQIPLAPLKEAGAPVAAAKPEPPVRRWPIFPTTTPDEEAKKLIDAVKNKVKYVPPEHKTIRALVMASSANRALVMREGKLRHEADGPIWPHEFTPLDLDTGIAAAPFVLDDRHPIEVHVDRRIALSRDGATLYMIGLDDKRTVEVRDMKGAKIGSWIPNPADKLEQLATLRGEQIRGDQVLVRTEHEMSLWERNAGKTRGLYRQPDVVSPFALDPTKTRVAIGLKEGWRIAEVQTGRTIVKLSDLKLHDRMFGDAQADDSKAAKRTIPPQSFDLIAFSPDSRRLAWLSTYRTVEKPAHALVVWDAETGAISLRETIGREILRPLGWLDNDTVWLGDVAFSVARKAPVRWMPATSPRRPLDIALDGRLALVDRDSAKVQRLAWPDEEGRRTLERLDKEPRTIVLRPGDTIDIVSVFKEMPEMPVYTAAYYLPALNLRFQDLGFIVKKGSAKVLRLEISPREPGTALPRATFEWRENDRVLSIETFVPGSPVPSGRRGESADKHMEAIYQWILRQGPRVTVVRSGAGLDPVPSSPIRLTDWVADD